MMMHDHPINGKEEDQLGVSRFAENLAQKLLDSKTRISSTAIGIVAPWGYGKSSILNLMKKELERDLDKNKLLIFDFNPWIYSKRSNLTSEYINTLENKIAPIKEGWQTTTKAINEYRKALTPILSMLNKGIAPMIKANVPFGETVWETLKNFISLNLEAKTNKNLEDCKDAINSSLEGKKVIVFIDDIDRLPANEVMDILRMVKSICNFTNCVYVLAYDEDYVINAIKKEFSEKGDDYLEKIVSFPYKLPEYSNETLIKFLKVGIQGIVETEHYQQLIETEHCQALLEMLVPLYLQTPRRIKRLLNAFSTSYMIAGTTLHWGDLLAIEALKQYSKETYETISKNKEWYLKTVENQQVYEINKNNHANTDTSKEDKRLSLLSGSKDKERELVSFLFPLFRTNLYGRQTSANAYEERRVCLDDFFKNYFDIELNDTVLTEKEIQQLIAVLDTNPERFSEQLTAYTQENSRVLTSTLTTLIDRVPKMEHTKQETLLEWFFTSLDEYTGTPQSRTNWRFFHDLFVNLLKPTINPFWEVSPQKIPQFYEWLCRIKNIEILSLLLYYIQNKQSTSLLRQLQLNTEQIEHLEKLVTDNFYELIKNPKFFESTHPIPYEFLALEQEWRTSESAKRHRKVWFNKAKVYPNVLSTLLWEACMVPKAGFSQGLSLGKLLEWGVDHEEVIAFLPNVIEYCKNNDSEKVPFMEQFLEEVTELSTD
jgi:predicted KAP-like P-loop ATPase